MTDLADQHCTACRGDEKPFTSEEVQRFMGSLTGWEAVEDHHLVKRWELDDFVAALALANRFGEIAEEEGHHPVLEFSWGWIVAKIWSHKIDGLTLNDFVLAARFDRAAGTR